MSVASDGMEYADVSALDAAWPETDGMAAVSTWTVETSVVHGGTYAAELAVVGTTGANESCYREKTFSTLRPNVLHRVRMYVWLNEEAAGSDGIAFGVEVVGGGSGYIELDGTIEDWVAISAEGYTNASGELTVRIGAFEALAATYDRLARFDDLTIEEVAEWPRAIPPQRVSDFEVPGALMSTSQTGRQQRRSTMQIGRRWSETYPPFKANSAEGRAFLAFIRSAWRNGTSFPIQHYLHLTQLGSGTGTARVAGGSQTGVQLATDGWTGTDPVLKAGDLFSIAGIGPICEVLHDAPDLSSGATTLTLTTPFFSGGSPDDNAILTYTDVRLTAMIAVAPTIPDAGPDHFIGGLTLVFEEVVT